ncbi:MAG: YdcF family protein [Planctomycetota bacterium]
MSALLGRLLLPPISILLLAAAGALVVRRRRRLGIGLMAASFASLALLSTPLVATALLKSLEWDAPRDPRAGADGAQAIVVLGAGLEPYAPEYAGATPGALSVERARYGAFLARRLRLPVLVTGGALDPRAPALGPLLKKTLTADFGIEDVRWVDSAAGNTWENAVRAAELLAPEGIGRVVLVTHAWHLPRARYAFETAGLEVVAAPTGFRPSPRPLLGDFLPSTRGLRQSTLALHEWLGLLWYRLRYR